MVFIQAMWSQLPISNYLLGIFRFKVKINFLPNILHGFKINLFFYNSFQSISKMVEKIREAVKVASNIILSERQTGKD